MHQRDLILDIVELFLRVRLLFFKFPSFSLLKFQLHRDLIRGGPTRILILRRKRCLALIFFNSKRFFIHFILPIVLEAILSRWERVTLRY